MPSAADQLPKLVCNELYMTAALRCYSVLCRGRGKKNSELYVAMSDLYHGKSPSIPSHIKLLADASFCFKDIYDKLEESNVTDKNSTESQQDRRNKKVLKPKLHQEKSKTFIAGIDITSSDLEKRNRTGTQLAKKGTGNYCKALAYASKKIDLDTLQCKESGTTVDDVIDYVRTEMCKELMKPKETNENSIDDEIVINENEEEEEYIIPSNEDDVPTTSSEVNENQNNNDT